MELKLQADAWLGNEPKFYQGTIRITAPEKQKEALFKFTLEKFDEGGEAEEKTIFHVTEDGKPVFTPQTMHGTTNMLHKLCLAAVQMAIDNLNEAKTRMAVYTATLFCPNANTSEILKFLHEIKTVKPTFN